MTDLITPGQFHEADGVDDWRLLAWGVCAHFRTDSVAHGASLVAAVGELGAEDAVDPNRRNPSIWFQEMDAPRPQRNRMHIDVFVPHDQAEARVAAAIAAGGRLVSDANAPSAWLLADPEGNEVDVATWMGRD